METVKGRVLPLIVENRESLRAIWMPFILSGALFVPDVKDAFLGERIFLLLLLPGDQQRIGAAGRVVWINSAATAARQGIGIRLEGGDGAAKAKIEECLAGLGQEGGRELFL